MTLEKYIEHFDKTFGTDVLKSMKERNYPMLDFAFNELGEKLYFAKGSEKNIKLTTKENLEIFKAYLTLENNKQIIN